MSLSLSSLLNPSPDPDAGAESHTSPPPPPPQPSSAAPAVLPPIQYVQSPQQQYATSPQTVHPPHQSHHSYPPPTEQDPHHTLASIPGPSNPPPLQSQWYPSQGASDQSYDGVRRSSSYDRRPGSSGYGEAIQLPPPPLPTATRQNSSPTLDQYHVASRSPEQRRASLISPVQPNFTLPPIQSISPTQQLDLTRRSPSSHAQNSIYDNPQLPVSCIETTSSMDVQKEQSSSTQRPSSPHDREAPPAQLVVKTSDMSARSEEMDSSPATIKQEALGTPRVSSPAEVQGLKPFTTKTEHSAHTHSPLRDSSVPVPSTEASAPDPPASKKRPAPSKTKKGTATATTKKAPPSKKRKVDASKSKAIDRALTPLKALSSKGATPATSSPAPSTRSVSAEPDDDAYEDDEDMDSGDAGSSDDVYCICRKPDTGTFMIGCDGTCDDWFHGKCVGIEERDKNLIDKYVCPTCTKAGAVQTTWKRMCRRSGCRQPARVGKGGKGGKEGGSKYCSEECGTMFFNEMIAKTRGKQDMMKNKHSRRKGSLASPEQPRDDPDDDLGARGGALAAGELKALVNATKTADDFKKLGDGVLSPPATPDSKASPTTTKHDFTESETHQLDAIHKHKDAARRKHQLLKDRMQFVSLAKQAGARAAADKQLKPKEFCGYDSRIEWTEAQFAAWRAGKHGLDLETLAGEEMEDFEVCERKKCARHLEWGKLAVDDLRFEMGENSNRMRECEGREREVRERVLLRSKGGAG